MKNKQFVLKVKVNNHSFLKSQSLRNVLFDFDEDALAVRARESLNKHFFLRVVL